MPSELRVDKISSTTSPYDPVFSTTGGALSHRNMVVNGDMRIAQRGTSAVTADSQFPVDRFRTDVTNNGSFSLQQVSESPANFQHSLKWTVTGTDTSLSSAQYAYFRTRIEGYDVAHLNWGTSDAQTVTLSFYIKSSVTGTFGGAIWNNSFNRSYPFSYTVSTTDWERKSITIPGDTTGTWNKDTTCGMNIAPIGSAGSTYSNTAGAWVGSGEITATGATNIMATNSATYHITGVQLELGSVATPFEHRSYGDELQRCQRYFQVHSNIALKAYVSGGTVRHETYVPLPVPMRATPTRAVTTTGNTTNVRSPATTYSGINYYLTSDSVVLQMESAATGLVAINGRTETLTAEV